LVREYHKGSAIGSGSDEDGEGRLLPGALDTTEPGGSKLGHMPLDTVDKPVVVQKATARPEEALDRGIAGEDFFAASEIVQNDRGNDEVERASDSLRPGRIEKVAEDIRQPVGTIVKAPASLVEHRTRIILQGDPSRRKCRQNLLGDDAVARTDVQH